MFPISRGVEMVQCFYVPRFCHCCVDQVLGRVPGTMRRIVLASPPFAVPVYLAEAGRTFIIHFLWCCSVFEMLWPGWQPSEYNAATTFLGENVPFRFLDGYRPLLSDLGFAERIHCSNTAVLGLQRTARKLLSRSYLCVSVVLNKRLSLDDIRCHVLTCSRFARCLSTPPLLHYVTGAIFSEHSELHIDGSVAFSSNSASDGGAQYHDNERFF